MLETRLAQISLLVKDYDEAIQYYTEVMGFDLIEDTQRSETKRWVVVQPKHPESCRLLLAKAKNEEQLKYVGRQTGGRVFLFLYTNDFDQYFAHLQKHNIKVFRAPSVEDFGKVAVVEDLYGNLWDLIEPAKQ